jgi:hypothetical protein
MIVPNNDYGGNYMWRPKIDLEVKSINARQGHWDTNCKHLCTVLTNTFYVSNVDSLFDFWINFCKNTKLNDDGTSSPNTINKIKLHICVTGELAEKIQKFINKLGLQNICVYTMSSMFGTLIFKCDYYFSLGFAYDPYAVWAHRNNKKLIMMKFGEIARAEITLTSSKDVYGDNLIEIPYNLGKLQLCREYLFESHHNCMAYETCDIYEHKEAENVPLPNLTKLTEILNNLQ